MSMFRFIFREKSPSLPTVYKAWFGRKYFVWKGKALHQSVEMLATDLDRKLRLGVKEDDQYGLIIHHIKYARIVQMEIEVIKQTENPAELLLTEHSLLQTSKGDELCLNRSFEVYVPKWIPESSIQEFQKSIAPQRGKRNRSANKAVKASGVKKESARRKSSNAGHPAQPRKASSLKGSSANGLKSKGSVKSAGKKVKAK